MRCMCVVWDMSYGVRARARACVRLAPPQHVHSRGSMNTRSAFTLTNTVPIARPSVIISGTSVSIASCSPGGRVQACPSDCCVQARWSATPWPLHIPCSSFWIAPGPSATTAPKCSRIQGVRFKACSVASLSAVAVYICPVIVLNATLVISLATHAMNLLGGASSCPAGFPGACSAVLDLASCVCFPLRTSTPRFTALAPWVTPAAASTAAAPPANTAPAVTVAAPFAIDLTQLGTAGAWPASSSLASRGRFVLSIRHCIPVDLVRTMVYFVYEKSCGVIARIDRIVQGRRLQRGTIEVC